MFFLVKSADKEYELHHSLDQDKRPICTIAHEAWANTIKDTLNDYEGLKKLIKLLEQENKELEEKINNLLDNERYSSGN
jgi:hypothetical protein